MTNNIIPQMNMNRLTLVRKHLYNIIPVEAKTPKQAIINPILNHKSFLFFILFSSKLRLSSI